MTHGGGRPISEMTKRTVLKLKMRVLWWQHCKAVEKQAPWPRESTNARKMKQKTTRTTWWTTSKLLFPASAVHCAPSHLSVALIGWRDITTCQIGHDSRPDDAWMIDSPPRARARPPRRRPCLAQRARLRPHHPPSSLRSICSFSLLLCTWYGSCTHGRVHGPNFAL